MVWFSPFILLCSSSVLSRRITITMVVILDELVMLACCEMYFGTMVECKYEWVM
jgi:hypothetical protein